MNPSFQRKLQGSIVICIVICYIQFTGCRPKQGRLDAEQQVLSVPESFQGSGATWSRKEAMSEKDQVVLEDYFRKHPSLVDGGSIQGEPLVYVNDRNHRRFYWISDTAESNYWFMIEVANRSIRQSEGADVPFQ